jgi:WD40 repeat protein
VIACVWDATTGKKLIWLKDLSSATITSCTSAVFRFDGKCLLTACADNVARLWDLRKVSPGISSPPPESPKKNVTGPVGSHRHLEPWVGS